MYNLIRNGTTLKQVVLIPNGRWSFEESIQELVFSDEKKANEIAKSIGAEVVLKETAEKMAA